MKKLLFLMLGVLSCMLNGCTLDDYPDVEVMPQAQDCSSDLVSSDDPCFEKYLHYNDSVSAVWKEEYKEEYAQELTKGGSFSSKLRIIVKADVVGAGKGLLQTAKDRKMNIFTRLLNAIFRGVSHSIEVSINEGGKKKVPGGPQEFEGTLYRYVATIENPDNYVARMDYWVNKTGLELPSKHMDKTFVAKYHNLLLEMGSPNTTIPLTSVFSQEHLDYLMSEDFQNSFYQPALYYGGSYPYSPYYFYTSNLMSKGERIFKAFLQAIDNDTYALSNVNDVVVDYLSMIDGENISEDDKTLLQNAIVVASFSKTYWNENGF